MNEVPVGELKGGKTSRDRRVCQRRRIHKLIEAIDPVALEEVHRADPASVRLLAFDDGYVNVPAT